MIKGVIFDLDGTLLNTIDDLTNSVNDTYKFFNDERRNTNEQTMSMVGHGMKNLIINLFPGKDETFILKALDVFLDAYARQYKNCTKPYEGIKELVDSLIEKGYKVGVNSNKNNEYTMHLIKMHFPNMNLEYVTGVKPGDKIKPDPTNVNEIIKKMELKYDEVLYVGDSPTDYQTSKNANLKFVGVAWGYRTKEQIYNAGADIVVDKADEILNLL